MAVPISTGAEAAIERIANARRYANPDFAETIRRRLQEGLAGTDALQQTLLTRRLEAANLAGNGHALLYGIEALNRLKQSLAWLGVAGVSSVAVPAVAPLAGVVAQAPLIPLELINKGLHLANNHIPGNIVSGVAHFGGDAIGHVLPAMGHLGGIGAGIAAVGGLTLASYRGSLAAAASTLPATRPLWQGVKQFFLEKLNLGGLFRAVV